MPDYSEATVKVAGRFGITVADGPDTGFGPDVVWCDEGTVSFVALHTYTKVKPLGAQLGQAVIETTIDAEGYLTRSGQRFVQLVDLTSDAVNPQVAPGKSTHRVEFRNLRANGTPVAFETVNVRLAADAVDPVTGLVDLVDAMPVPTAGGTPIVVGPAGPAGPPGPGASDEDVAAYIAAPDTATVSALKAGFAEITGPAGAPLPPGTHVQIRLTPDFTDIDDIVVVED